MLQSKYSPSEEDFVMQPINLLLSLEKSDVPKLRQRYEKFNDGEESKRMVVGATYES